MKRSLLLLLLVALICNVYGQAPVVTSFSPAAGTVGTVITINGSNFNTDAASNAVLFGPVKAQVTNATTTQLTVKVPPGANLAPISVSNTANKLTGYSSISFIVAATPAVNVGVPVEFEPEIIMQPRSYWDSYTLGTLADIDGNGKTDILYNSGGLFVYQNLSEGGLSKEAFKQISLNITNISAINVADMNADGKTDIIISQNALNKIILLINNSVNGVINDAAFQKITITTTKQPFNTIIADIDVDGKPDIVTTDGSNVISMYHNKSVNGTYTTGSFSQRTDFTINIAENYSKTVKISVADLDNDGKPDMLVTAPQANNKSVIYRNTTTTGAITASAFFPSTEITSAYYTPASQIIADLNGDGKADIVLCYGVYGTLSFSIFENRSVPGSNKITYGPAVSYPPGSYTAFMNVADMDGDGKPDLICRSYTTINTQQLIYVFRNASTGGPITTSTFVNRQMNYIEPLGTPLNTGDLDGDGRPDLISIGKGFSIMRNNPLAPPVINELIVDNDAAGGPEIKITGERFSKTLENNLIYVGSVKAKNVTATSKALTAKFPAGMGDEQVSVTVKERGLTAYSKLKYSSGFFSRYEITSNDFAPKFEIPAGLKPSATAMSDLDGDGKTDLIVVNSKDDNIYIYRNVSATGTVSAGSLAEKVVLATGANPTSVIIADLDNDTKPEIIVTNKSGNTVSVFRNKTTTGAFTANSFASKIDLATGGGPVKAAVGDVDNDGRADIVTVNTTANTFSVLRNVSSPGSLGAASFLNRVDFTTGAAPSAIIMVDLNADNRREIVVSNYDDNSISVFTNSASRGVISASSFAARVNYPVGDNPSDIDWGQVYNRIFIVVANKGSNTVTAYIDNSYSYGSVNLGDRKHFETGASPVKIKLADIDGDRLPDIATLSGTGNALSLLRNTSTSAVFDPTKINFDAKVDIATGKSPLAVSVYDIDGDTRPELVVANSADNTLSVYHNRFLDNSPSITSFTPLFGLAGSEVTINGKNFDTTANGNIVLFGSVRATITEAGATKLVVKVPQGATYAPVIVVKVNSNLTASSATAFMPTFVNKNNLTASGFGNRISINAKFSEYSPSLHLSDIDGDGKIDMAVNYVGDMRSLLTYRNVAVKGTLNQNSFVKRDSLESYPSEIIDINGDGKPDLVEKGSGFVYQLNISKPGDSKSTFSDRKFIDIQCVKTADMNADGKPDIVGFNYSNIAISRNVTSSPDVLAFAGAFTIPADGYTSIEIADIDNDGKPDLIAYQRDKSDIFIFKNTSAKAGRLSFSEKITFNTGITLTGITFADMNLDGKADMIVTNNAGKNISVLQNVFNGTSTNIFASKATMLIPVTGTFNNHNITVAVSDMNGDNKPDIISSYLDARSGYYYRDTASSVNIFFNRNTGTDIAAGSFFEETVIKMGALRTPVAVADIDGDGRPDLLACVTQGIGILHNDPFKPPVITGFTPPFTTLGSEVIIQGENFSPGISNNIVHIGPVKATVKQVTPSAITVDVPVGASYGTVSVLSADKQLAASSVKPFSTSFLTDRNFKPGTFSSKITAPTGSKPGSSVMSDIDGDGKPDVIVANTGSNTISIFRNTYTGGTRTDIKTGNSPSFVTVADLDNDGKPEIIVSNSGSNTLTIYRNKSVSGSITTSSFEAGVDVPTGVKPVAIAVADIDGDGKQDILVANSGANTFSAFHNRTDGPGSFSVASFNTKVDFAVGGTPVLIAVADIDGDNAFDVLTANSGTNNISVLRNKAVKGNITNASFAAKVDFIGSGNMVHIATGDINGDGKADIIAVTKDENTLSVYRSSAVKDTITSSTFNGYQVIALNNSPSFIGIADMNGDSQPDVVVLNSGTDSLSVHKNNGGYFFEAVKYAAGKAPASACLGDVTGDGKADIVVVKSGSNAVTVLGNNLVNSPPVITSFNPPKGAPGTTVGIIGEHFDKLRENNIVYFGATRAQVVEAYENILVVTVPAGATYQPVSVLNKSKGLSAYSSVPFITTYTSKAPEAEPKVDMVTGKNPVAVAMGDINGDGKPDLLVSSAADNSVRIYPNAITGKGSFNSTSFAAGIKFSTGAAPASIALADFNADGKTDMVVANYNAGTISVLTGTGTTEISFLAKVDHPVGKNPSSVTVRDINGDGKPDILVANSGGSTVSVLRNTTVNNVTAFAPKYDVQTGPNPTSVAVADMNADGRGDIVTANFGGNSVSVLQNNTTPTSQNLSFAAKADLPVGKNPQSVALGDVDGDGKPDIITANKGSNNASVITNKHSAGNISAASFNTKKDFSTGNAPLFVALNDFTGDGKVDIITANSTSGTASILANNGLAGSASFAAKMDVAAGSTPQSLAAGDLDGDGKPDIAVANFAGNNVSLIRSAPVAIPAPVITSFSPKAGPAGTLITITGTNFNTSASQNLVVFGAVSAKAVSATATRLTVRVPAGATQQGLSVLDVTTGLAGKTTAPYVITYKGKSVVSEVDFKRLPLIPRSGNYYYTKVADMDGDGLSDAIAVDSYNGRIYLQRNVSDSSGIKFTGEVNISTGYFVQSLLIEDMDGDGKPDLVFLNNGRTMLSVIRNKSTPGNITQYSFEQRVDFSLSSEAQTISIADVDADGKPDVAVSYYYGYNADVFAIYRNIAVAGTFNTGSLEARVDNVLGGYGTMLVGDVNNDNKPDAAALAYSNTGTTDLTVFKNVVPGYITSSAFVSSAPKVASQVSRFKFADIDGDGKPDLITLSSARMLNVYRNISGTQGNFSFEAGVSAVTLPETVNDFTVGDINGDGRPDIVFSTYYNARMYMVLNKNVSGSVKASLFGSPVRYSNVSGNGGEASIADMDNDGRPDIVTDNFTILRNEPDYALPSITLVSPLSGNAGTVVTITGTNFNTAKTGNIVYFGAVPAKVLTATETVLTVEVPAGATYQPVSVQNTSKGLIASSKKYFNLTFSSKPLSFKPRVTFATPNKPAGMCIYDVDVDGKPDMIVANSVNQVISVYRNIAVSGSINSASFAAKVDVPVDGAPLAVAAGDLDGDGKPEIIAANNSGKKISVYGNSSSAGTINASSFTLKFSIQLNANPLDVKVIDIEGDGKLDILVTEAVNGYYSYTAYFNRQSGALTASSFARNYISSNGTRQATWASDMDDDNKPDFITVGYREMIGVSKNSFEIGFTYSPQLTGNSFTAGTEPQSICTGDIDGDGKPEIIVANKASNTISILRNTIINNVIDYYAFAPAVDLPVPVNPKRVSVGDVNGDGKLDIVATFYDSNKVMVYYNNATAGDITVAAFAEQKELDGGTDADHIHIGDLDGDGRADFAFTNFSNNTISVIQNLGTAGLSANAVMADDVAANAVNRLNIYPNPAVSYANVQYHLPVSSDVEVKMFDKTGKQVRSYHIKGQTAGTHQTEVKVDDINEGIYMITVTAKGYHQTGKLIKR